MNDGKKELSFFKDAFCIDGEVKIVSPKNYKQFKTSVILQLNDSKRGTFYLGIMKRVKV